MSQQLKIGIDLMGNDNAPHVLLATLKELFLPQGVQLLAITNAEVAKRAGSFPCLVAPEVIEMDESPLLALRKKKNASMTMGLRLLREKKIDALVSAGNTGALISGAKIILSTLKGVLRPALLALMPTKKNPVAVLDVGANIEAKARHLVQFARIGASYQRARGIEHPTVGLLNIGSEPLKGTSALRQAYRELEKKNQHTFRFVGNIEGKSAFDGEVDVLVTDGFTGNVFLKTAEGTASFILDRIQPHIPSSEIKKLQSLHYAEYPGALLVGVQGIVVKCHGYSTPKGFINAILGSAELVKEKFVQKLENDL